MAIGFLERQVKNFERSISPDRAKKATNGADVFEHYRNCKANKEVLSCRFELADDQGNLSLVDANGVKVILPADSFKESSPYYSARIKDRFIGTIELSVKVNEVDEANNCVIVESSHGSDSTKGSIMRSIFNELKKGNHPRLMGVVIKVTDERAVVNILNQNILGFISVKHWQPIYTRSLKEFCNRGDVVEFEVVNSVKKAGKDYAFILDRTNVAPNPWKELADFPVGTSIICKCVDKPSNRNFWWGVSNSVPGIEVMGNFSEAVSVRNSCYYKCKVRSYDKDKQILRVVPFEVVPVGFATASNISFISTSNKSK